MDKKKILIIAAAAVLVLAGIVCALLLGRGSAPAADTSDTTDGQTFEAVGGVDTIGDMLLEDEDTTGETAETTQNQPETTGSDTAPEQTGQASQPDAPSSDSSDDVPQTSQPSAGAENTEKPVGSGVTLEQYEAMSGEEQIEFSNQFPSLKAFIDWYNAAKAEADESGNDIVIGTDPIDMDDLLDGSD